MALKALMLRKKIDSARKRLEELRAKSEDFDRRDKELEAAIAEAATPEEQRTVEEEVQKYDQERSAYDSEMATLEGEIEAMEAELADVEREDAPPPAPKHDDPTPAPAADTRSDMRKEGKNMNHRSKIRAAMARRPGMMEREDVKGFLTTVRESIANTRAITNAGLLIPNVVMGVLRENVTDYSKLYKHVNAQYVPGTTRTPVMANVPEAVWTEMCAAINELSLGFGAVDTDGFKVAGFFTLCNAVAEDSDDELIVSIVDSLGHSIGIALDKAILYGTGIKMPLGIVTRLVQTAKPTDYPDIAPAWVDLHTSNVVTISAANSTGTKLFASILKAAGNADDDMATDGEFWAMNKKTLNTLKAEALSINAAGAIVSGMEGTMPVVGGAAETLSFIPDNVILGGYGSLYFLAERQGTRITSSEHALFIPDQTVYKGVARYDGKPAIPAGFVAIGINGTTPTAAMTFAPDTANAKPDPEEPSK